MTKLALYLFLGFLAFGLIGAVIALFAQASSVVAKTVLDVLAFAVGKASGECKLVIPAQLSEAEKNPKPDNDLVNLKNYRAEYDPAIFPSIPYVSEAKVQNETDASSNTSELLDKANLLKHPIKAADFSFIDEIKSEKIPDSFLSIPKKPSHPSPPPKWTPWVVITEDVRLELPRFTGRLSFLNSLVTKCYESQITLARRRQNEIEVLRSEATKRNADAERLDKRNQSNYQMCCQELEERWNRDVEHYKFALSKYKSQLDAKKKYASELERAIQTIGAEGLLERVNYALENSALPSYISREGKSSFDEASGIFIHEHQFPDLSKINWIKLVEPRSKLDKLKNIRLKKPATIKESKDAAISVYPSLSIRLCKDILSQDSEKLVRAIAINGWCDYVEKSTGQTKRAYCSSLFVTREQVEEINNLSVDPVEAFSKLKGVTAKTIEITPIAPIIRLDTSDPRFVDSKEILANLQSGQNLAAMDWEDFEHLCRELFERAFAGSGAEVKVTQASRDQGVDAIVFDPDPIRGGKIIIQAKRYTNTVDVSAVRDLYGALINEGATKGILVTTSQYGPESYSFAKDKPITLLNGQELLGLLEKFDYRNFVIDLESAKKALRL